MKENKGLNMNEVKNVERGLARRIESSLTGIEVEKALVFTRSWDERPTNGKIYPVIPKVILKLKGKNGKPGKTLIIYAEGKVNMKDGKVYTRLQFDMIEPKVNEKPKAKSGCNGKIPCACADEFFKSMRPLNRPLNPRTQNLLNRIDKS